jgi:hypothetical protein
MSSPKEKARELFDRHLISQFIMSRETAKAHSLITVDEIINECGDRCLFSKCDYWKEVKQEIEKL